jgi:hypothetical protein
MLGVLAAGLRRRLLSDGQHHIQLYHDEGQFLRGGNIPTILNFHTILIGGWHRFYIVIRPVARFL